MVCGQYLFNSYYTNVWCSHLNKSGNFLDTVFINNIITAKHYALFHFFAATAKSRHISKPLYFWIELSVKPFENIVPRMICRSTVCHPPAKTEPDRLLVNNDFELVWCVWQPKVYSTHEHVSRQTRESASQESKQINYPLGMRIGWSRDIYTCFFLYAMHIAIVCCSLRSRWSICGVGMWWYIAGHPKRGYLHNPSSIICTYVRRAIRSLWMDE